MAPVEVAAIVIELVLVPCPFSLASSAPLYVAQNLVVLIIVKSTLVIALISIHHLQHHAGSNKRPLEMFIPYVHS